MVDITGEVRVAYFKLKAKEESLAKNHFPLAWIAFVRLGPPALNYCHYMFRIPPFISFHSIEDNNVIDDFIGEDYEADDFPKWKNRRKFDDYIDEDSKLFGYLNWKRSRRLLSTSTSTIFFNNLDNNNEDDNNNLLLLLLSPLIYLCILLVVVLIIAC